MTNPTSHPDPSALAVTTEEDLREWAEETVENPHYYMAPKGRAILALIADRERLRSELASLRQSPTGDPSASAEHPTSGVPDALYLERWPEGADREDSIHYESCGYGINQDGYESSIYQYVRSDIAEMRTKLASLRQTQAGAGERWQVTCAVRGCGVKAPPGELLCEGHSTGTAEDKSEATVGEYTSERQHCRLVALHFYYKPQAVTGAQSDWVAGRGEIDDDDVSGLAQLLESERAAIRTRGKAGG